MKAMILAAGYGTRLGELTQQIPKPMLPLDGEPLLSHTIRYLAGYGFDEIAINLHYRPEAITEYFGDGRSFGVRLHYSHEPELLGTAGGVKNVEGFFSDVEDFLVIYGDLFLEQDLSALWRSHLASGASATLLLHRGRSNSLVQMDEQGRIVAFVERPTAEERQAHPYPWVNSGVQVLTHTALSHLKPGAFADLPKDVYIPRLREVPIHGFPLTGFRIAIDSRERYAEAQQAALQTRTAGRLTVPQATPKAA
jgi:NDP-sugar pyrophosphorylase family protein